MLGVGTALQAIEFATSISPEQGALFLHEWKHGDIEDWPEYLKYINASQDKILRDLILAASQDLHNALLPVNGDHTLRLLDAIEAFCNAKLNYLKYEVTKDG